MNTLEQVVHYILMVATKGFSSKVISKMSAGKSYGTTFFVVPLFLKRSPQETEHVLQICSNFTGEQCVISVKPLCYFIKIKHSRDCSPINMLQICSTPFLEEHLSGTASNLNHSFPMHPFSTPRKNQKNVRFSDVFMGYINGVLGTNGLY